MTLGIGKTKYVERIDTVTFKTELGTNIFRQKYASNQYETWSDKAHSIVNSVCGTSDNKMNRIMELDDLDEAYNIINNQEFFPGGRYLWYAGREARFYNNCYLLRAEEDTREEWADLWKRAGSCLMTGGGIGIDVSKFRPSGRPLTRTGGVSSGPLPWLEAVNAIGREVMQGGSRRSALYGSMNWQHEDIWDFMTMKNWHDIPIQGAFKEDGSPFTVADAKMNDFNYKAPLDQMNISINYDDAWLNNMDHPVFETNVRQAMMTGEPGFSFNFGEKQNETLRNACTEITSEDDSDVCNLGSINMANIDTIERFREVVNVASKFLVCGLHRAQLPYEKVYETRRKNSRLGLGLMGMHEWLLKRGYKYEMVDELKQWLKVYKDESERSANKHCARLFLAPPKGYRAIAPTGTISILAGTTSGVEPIYAVAYRRRYLSGSKRWLNQYNVETIAVELQERYGLSNEQMDTIESSITLAKEPEKRIKFQYELQKYVDHAISSTVNLPAWGSEENNEELVDSFSGIIKKYAHGLRGLTFYPDGSRGGQPLTPCSWEEAMSKRGVVYEDNTEEQCLSGVCGI